MYEKIFAKTDIQFMKKIALFTVLSLFAFTGISQTNYSIKVKVEGIKDSLAYLGSYTGKNLFIYDTAVVKSDGSFEFNNTDMPHGVYAIIPSFKPPMYFDFIVNETNIQLETTMDNLVKDVKVKKSNENKLFFKYVKYLGDQANSKKPIIEERKIANDSGDMELVKQLDEKIIKIDKEVVDYQKNVARKHSDKLFGKLVKMSVEIDIPNEPKEVEDTNQWKYNYWMNHYWDNIDLSDDRLGKSALFYNQMNTYFMKVIPQVPDTITKRIDWFLAQLKPNGFMMKSAIEFLAYAHAKTKIMGMESVYVHVCDNYILNGKSEWIDKDRIEKLRPKVDKLRPTLIGKIAPNMILPDSTKDNWINLSKVNHDYTLLIFWSDDCGHCQKEIPKFKKFYDSIKKNTNIDIEVYAVCTNIENEGWVKFINEHNLDWINVSDYQDMRTNHMYYLTSGKTTLNSINYRNIYDVTVTPVAYLLDRNKKILAKQFDSKQAVEILKVVEHNKKTN